jgi:hypothetical protein
MEKRPQRVRINMRIHKDLVAWAKKYAKKKRTSVTQLIIEHLLKLKEENGG